MNSAGHHREMKVLKRIELNPNEKTEKKIPRKMKADDSTIELGRIRLCFSFAEGMTQIPTAMAYSGQ